MERFLSIFLYICMRIFELSNRFYLQVRDDASSLLLCLCDGKFVAHSG